MATLLEARYLTKVFGGGVFDRNTTVALEDFSIAIDGDRPSITAVVGESGSGKTTLARLLLGLVDAHAGRGPLSRARPAEDERTAEMRTFRRDVQVIFQDPYEVYNPFYRVDHVLTTPVSQVQAGLDQGRRAQSVIEDALEAVGLRPEETLGRFPHQLSGGQRQRVMVARALLLRAPHDPGRRAGVDGRRVPAGHDPGLAPHDDPGARHFHHLHHPRPGDGLSDQREHRRAVPRVRGGGRGRGVRGQAPAPSRTRSYSSLRSPWPAPSGPGAARASPPLRSRPPELPGAGSPTGAHRRPRRASRRRRRSSRRSRTGPSPATSIRALPRSRRERWCAFSPGRLRKGRGCRDSRGLAKHNTLEFSRKKGEGRLATCQMIGDTRMCPLIDDTPEIYSGGIPRRAHVRAQYGICRPAGQRRRWPCRSTSWWTPSPRRSRAAIRPGRSNGVRISYSGFMGDVLRVPPGNCATVINPLARRWRNETRTHTPRHESDDDCSSRRRAEGWSPDETQLRRNHARRISKGK